MGTAELADVTFAYDTGPPVLNGVSFKVGEGDHTALVGANGAGKTTVLRLLARQLEPVDGTVSSSGSFAYMDQMVGSTPGGRFVTSTSRSPRTATPRRPTGWPGPSGP